MVLQNALAVFGPALAGQVVRGHRLPGHASGVQIHVRPLDRRHHDDAFANALGAHRSLAAGCSRITAWEKRPRYNLFPDASRHTRRLELTPTHLAAGVV